MQPPLKHLKKEEGKEGVRGSDVLSNKPETAHDTSVGSSWQTQGRTFQSTICPSGQHTHMEATKTKMPGIESEVLVRSVACLLVGQHEIK